MARNREGIIVVSLYLYPLHTTALLFNITLWSKVNTYCQYLLVLLVNPKAIPRSSQAIRCNTKVANTLVGIGNPRQHFG
ncbi:hypothetical protein KCU67_g73, partial [Aureobasidium melanogenum]